MDRISMQIEHIHVGILSLIASIILIVIFFVQLEFGSSPMKVIHVSIQPLIVQRMPVAQYHVPVLVHVGMWTLIGFLEIMINCIVIMGPAVMYHIHRQSMIIHYIKCFEAQIQCPQNAECNITCNGHWVCEQATIICPEYTPCNVNCISSTTACEYMIIHWSSNPDYAHLTCTNDADCNYAKLPSIINPPNNDTNYSYNCTDKQCISSTLNCPTDADCIINCLRGDSCIAATINCPINGNCILICGEYGRCDESIIHGPINHNFEVYCLDNDCKKMQIHAENSGFFKLVIGNDAIATTRDMSIWFPPKDEVTHAKKA